MKIKFPSKLFYSLAKARDLSCLCRETWEHTSTVPSLSTQVQSHFSIGRASSPLALSSSERGSFYSDAIQAWSDSVRPVSFGRQLHRTSRSFFRWKFLRLDLLDTHHMSVCYSVYSSLHVPKFLVWWWILDCTSWTRQNLGPYKMQALCLLVWGARLPNVYQYQ